MLSLPYGLGEVERVFMSLEEWEVLSVLRYMMQIVLGTDPFLALLALGHGSAL
jgi:hypothetical protein